MDQESGSTVGTPPKTPVPRNEAGNLTGATPQAPPFRAGWLTDPTRLRRFHTAYHTYPAGWVLTILGTPAPGSSPLQVPPASTVRWNDIALLLTAAELDPGFETRHPAIAAAEAAEAAARESRRAELAANEGRARAEEAARRAAWTALRTRLPVPVFVGHNWTIGHYDGYVTGRDHIVVQEHLHVGRLTRHKHHALCETNSVTTRGRLDPLRALDRSPGPVALDALGFSRGEECASPRHRAVYGVRHVCRGCST